MNYKDSIISKIKMYRLNVPLIKPYKLSYNTFHSFEPLLIHIIDDEGMKDGENNTYLQDLVLNLEMVGGYSLELYQN